jgi:hypothetical protein
VPVSGQKQSRFQGIYYLGDHLEDQAYSQRAADAFQLVEGLPGDLVIPERMRAEIVNQQALIAVRRGELDLFSSLLVEGVKGARAQASEKQRARCGRG